MISKELIQRINELAHKAKAQGLSKEEQDEREKLRREYLLAFRANLKSQLDNIRYVEDLSEEELQVEAEARKQKKS